MPDKKLLTALKHAMRGEMDSITVYQNAAKNSTDPEVVSFFENWANEEKQHYNYLLALYQSVSKFQELQPIQMEDSSNLIFSAEFVKRIGSSNLLFSAISVATLLEKNAFEFYQKSAADSNDPVLKNFFEKMAFWEKHHYDILLEIAEEAKETYWQENRFEPF
ncbi:ferritin family protein [Candidatus Cloacimonadota bacterium]